MKIGIISDTHDNIPNIDKAINWLNEQGIKTLLHCGDVSTKETMSHISEIFKGDIFAVFGNMDIDPGGHWKFSNVKIFPEICEVNLEGKEIAIIHRPEPARKLAEIGKYDIVFYGHTHRPWEERVSDCRLVNPGEMAGQIYRPSFAVYDTQTDKLELKILE